MKTSTMKECLQCENPFKGQGDLCRKCLNDDVRSFENEANEFLENEVNEILRGD